MTDEKETEVSGKGRVESGRIRRLTDEVPVGETTTGETVVPILKTEEEIKSRDVENVRRPS